jgi:hypothetical protein
MEGGDQEHSRKSEEGIASPLAWRILILSIRKYRPARYFLAVTGLAASATIIGSLFAHNWMALSLAAFVILLAAIAIVVFGRITKLDSRILRAPAIALTWFVVLIIMSFAVLLFISFFFSVPLHFAPNRISESAPLRNSIVITARIAEIAYNPKLVGMDMTHFPKGFQQVLSDVYIDKGAENGVSVGDYFKILVRKNLPTEKLFSDYKGIIKINSIDRETARGKILWLKIRDKIKNNDWLVADVGDEVVKIDDAGNEAYAQIQEEYTRYSMPLNPMVKFIGDDVPALFEQLKVSMKKNFDGGNGDLILREYKLYQPYSFLDVDSQNNFNSLYRKMEDFAREFPQSCWISDVHEKKAATAYMLGRYSEVIAIVSLIKLKYTDRMEDGQLRELDQMSKKATVRMAIEKDPLSASKHADFCTILKTCEYDATIDLPEAMIEAAFAYIISRNGLFFNKFDELGRQYNRWRQSVIDTFVKGGSPAPVCSDVTP